LVSGLAQKLIIIAVLAWFLFLYKRHKLVSVMAETTSDFGALLTETQHMSIFTLRAKLRSVL